MSWEKERTKHELEEKSKRDFDLIVKLGLRVNELEKALKKIGEVVTGKLEETVGENEPECK